jgi:hypothetical protein
MNRNRANARGPFDTPINTRASVRACHGNNVESPRRRTDYLNRGSLRYRDRAGFPVERRPGKRYDPAHSAMMADLYNEHNT